MLTAGERELVEEIGIYEADIARGIAEAVYQAMWALLLLETAPFKHEFDGHLETNLISSCRRFLDGARQSRGQL
jgi:hypothetical protein